MALLEVKSIGKKYRSFTLKDVSFSLEKGRITGFIGRNGAGKTTVLKLLYALIKRDGGSILYEGEDILTCEKRYKNEVGLLFGGFQFYPGFKLKKITSVLAPFYEKWDQAQYEEYLTLFGLDEEKKVKELSAGMQVKYGLAIALSHGAEILLLDEPTSGLDPVSRDELLDLFENLAQQGKSILFSTHVISDLDKCADDIVYIQKGSLLAAEPLARFRDRYIAFDGESSLLEKKDRSHFLYLHDHGGRFQAVAKKEDEAAIPLSSRKATLEEIMIALERGKEEA